MGDDKIVVNKSTILTLINSVRQFCNITEIKGFDSIDMILGIEVGLEKILQSAATVSEPKEVKQKEAGPKEVEKPQQNTTK